jgi:putative CocE/NonD family hydrolase
MPANYAVEMRWNAKVPMRDGVRLSTDLYLPRAAGKFPTVLIRTPYNNNSESLINKGRLLANSGYACAIQDCRGRWDSEGEFLPLLNEGPDGFDTQQWIGVQEWSNGKVGMVGGSYLGWVQLQSAPYRSQYLTCLAPSVIVGDWFSGVHPGGALLLNTFLTWGLATDGHTAQSLEYENWTETFRRLPLKDMVGQAGRDIPYWQDWIGRQTRDEYWQELSLEGKWGEIAVPALNLGGWYDVFMPHTFAIFNNLRQHGRTSQARQSRVVVGPWVHALSNSPRTGEIDFGAHSMLDLDALQVRWLDYWLKGEDNGVDKDAPLKLFIMGVNQWREEQEWPLARTQWQKWYLHSGGKANSLLGDGQLSPQAPDREEADRFVYDPRYPVQTLGGNNCCWPHIVPWGPHDQRCAEMRGDVLCYTSAPLKEDLEVTGPIKVMLHAATDAPDTDFTAKLVDVWPTGYAMNLCDGIVRARFREGFAQPRLLEPNRVYEYQIDLGVTGNVFRKGHSLRVEISSSNFPRFDRNLNTGEPLGAGAQMRQARQTVYHERAYPSHIVLPVIPTGK